MKTQNIKFGVGTWVCFMNSEVVMERDEIGSIGPHPKKANKTAITLKYSKIVLDLEDQDMLFADNKRERLHNAIQALKLSTETCYSKLKQMLIEMMETDEYRPIILPEPNRPNQTGYDESQNN